jgi:hypothetical protein
VKKIALGFFLATTQVLAGLAAEEPIPVLQLTLSPDKLGVVAGNNFVLAMRVVSLSAGTVDCASVVTSDNFDVAYIYDIRASDRKPVPLEHPDADGIQVHGSKVMRGKGFETSISLPSR